MNAEIIEAGEVRFGEPETITVADLRAGDFVVQFMPYLNVRGLRVGSGVQAVEERFGTWKLGPARRKNPIPSRVVRFISFDSAPDVPSATPVVVRRRIG